MQDMLHIAQDNIKMTQDRAQFYAVHNREPRVFNPRQKVFLRVPHNSKTLSTGKCTKLVLCTHNVGEGRSLIFTLVKGMFTIIKKGTNDWIE